MEGPGGYQFVGRTVQIWNRFRYRDQPWALRFFDRIEWYPVTAEELLELRAESDAGRLALDTAEGTFSLAEYDAFLAANAESIASFRRRQSAAFEAEKERWRATGEFDRRDTEPPAPASEVALPVGATAVTAPFTATVWQLSAAPGDLLAADDPVLSLEAMKMEAKVTTPVRGTLVELYVKAGEQVAPGQILAAVRP